MAVTSLPTRRAVLAGGATLAALPAGAAQFGRPDMLASADLQTIICTSRMAEAKRFYGETLGLAMKGVSHGAAVFDVGGCELRVSPVPSTNPTEHTVLGFSVSDVRATVETLTERGVQFERFQKFPHDKHGIVRTPDGAHVAWFRDPDGNLLSIVQYS